MGLDFIEESAEEQVSRSVSANVAEDIVEVSRGNVIANEEVTLLSTLQYATGWLYSMDRYVNSVLIGPSAGGKTMVQRCTTSLVPSKYSYETTDATNNAMLDDPEWDTSLVAPLDEFDKISKPVRKFMKSMAGEDRGYTKKRDVEDPDSASGFSPVTISSSAMPFQFLYAPQGAKSGIPKELDTRMLKLHVEDSKPIRRAIGRKEAGHDHIDIRTKEHTYVYDTTAVEAAIRDHVRSLPTTMVGDGEEEHRRGNTFVRMPRWVWYAVTPIFNHGQTYTNRVFGMVFNLIRSSTLLNHHDRRTVDIDVEGESREAYVVEPQDVANVLVCQETLLATTHQLDPRKRNILKAVEGASLSEGMTTIDAIKNWLDDNDIPHPSKSTLRDLLRDLADDYFVRIVENATDNGAHAYQQTRNGSLDVPRVKNLAQYAKKDDLALGAEAEDSVSRIDPDEPFVDAVDPLRDQSFVETVAELASDFDQSTHPDENETATSAGLSMSEAMGVGEDDDGGQATLGESPSASAIPDATVTVAEMDATEQAVYSRVLETVGDGQPFPSDYSPAHAVGAIESGETPSEADLTGTLLDPDHDVWQSRPDHDEERVVNESDARREVDEALSRLGQYNVVFENVEDQPAGFVELVCQEVDDE